MKTKVIERDGLFFPMQRLLCFWFGFQRENDMLDPEVVSFKSAQEAEAFLASKAAE